MSEPLMHRMHEREAGAMDPEQLRQLDAIANAGTMSAAARTVHTSRR